MLGGGAENDGHGANDPAGSGGRAPATSGASSVSPSIAPTEDRIREVFMQSPLFAVPRLSALATPIVKRTQTSGQRVPCRRLPRPSCASRYAKRGGVTQILKVRVSDVDAAFARARERGAARSRGTDDVGAR